MSQPLSDITVLDFGHVYNGPYCGFLLAMAGARVIKIESPQGETLRARRGKSYPFAMLNSSKDTITLNLKHEQGRELLRQMVAKADVLLENFAPGTMEKLGVGAEALCKLNPRLIYAGASGYGKAGLHSDFMAMDITIQAMSGIMSVTGPEGGEPLKAGPAMCDFLGGVHLYSAIVTALYRRTHTGDGAVVDVAMQDASILTLASNFNAYFNSGSVPPRTGNHAATRNLAPYNVYQAKDGHVAIICIREGHWRNLVKAMNQPELMEDERFKDMQTRSDNMQLTDDTVEAWTSQLPKQEIFQLAREHEVICAPVQDLEEVLQDKHLHARGMLQEIEHPEFGKIPLPSTPLRFVGEDAPTPRPSRGLGQDNEAVYYELLGLSATEVETLKANEVI